MITTKSACILVIINVLGGYPYKKTLMPSSLFLVPSGVAKIINKLNGQPFDENDEQLFEVSLSYVAFLGSICND